MRGACASKKYDMSFLANNSGVKGSQERDTMIPRLPLYFFRELVPPFPPWMNKNTEKDCVIRCRYHEYEQCPEIGLE